MSLRRPIVIDNKVQLIDDIVYTYIIWQLATRRSGDLCNNKRIITGAKAIPYGIAMGVDLDSMTMLDHVEFDAQQTSDLAETMAKRLLKGISLTWGWTHHDLPSLHELMQSSMEALDSQPGEVASPNEDYLYDLE